MPIGAFLRRIAENAPICIFPKGVNALDYSGIEQLALKHGADFIRNEPLGKYTSFRIGGNADAVIKPNSAECAVNTIKYCNETGIPYYLLGRGSNVLISDNGLRGLVIIISDAFSEISADKERLICDAGASLNKICIAAKELSLTGLEFAYGIPGTVGGALYMNAGAYGGEMKDVVEYCEFLDEGGNVRRLPVEELELSYRHSFFTEKKCVILRVALKLKKGEYDAISERMSELIAKRRNSQPLDYPSAGSTFKRPQGDFAARLIEASGLKGYSCGGAEVSVKHSGFVINKGNASFSDVMGVINGVKEKVYSDSGVMLECEVLILE